MPDIIHLLPESIANQIAAGEVVQRPASVVKELIENAIDAGASRIQVIVKDAGKSLIQVIDDGSGMSVTDARMCFERHATSKIRTSEDLFSIRTMGFRGEALASIAAVAQVQLKTRLSEEELGNMICIEGSKIVESIPVATPAGTSVEVKNLFRVLRGAVLPVELVSFYEPWKHCFASFLKEDIHQQLRVLIERVSANLNISFSESFWLMQHGFWIRDLVSDITRPLLPEHSAYLLDLQVNA